MTDGEAEAVLQGRVPEARPDLVPLVELIDEARAHLLSPGTGTTGEHTDPAASGAGRTVLTGRDTPAVGRLVAVGGHGARRAGGPGHERGPAPVMTTGTDDEAPATVVVLAADGRTARRVRTRTIALASAAAGAAVALGVSGLVQRDRGDHVASPATSATVVVTTLAPTPTTVAPATTTRPVVVVTPPVTAPTTVAPAPTTTTVAADTVPTTAAATPPVTGSATTRAPGTATTRPRSTTTAKTTTTTAPAPSTTAAPVVAQTTTPPASKSAPPPKTAPPGSSYEVALATWNQCVAEQRAGGYSAKEAKQRCGPQPVDPAAAGAECVRQKVAAGMDEATARKECGLNP